MPLPFIDRLPAAEAARFTLAVRQLASRLGIKPEWVMVVMYRESELKPTARNSQSGATGLIQFTKPAAAEAGTTREALYRMTATQQLPYVETYYRNRIAERKQRPQSVYDLYMLTLHPTSMGKPDNAVVFAKDSTAYRQNHSLDKSGKGFVTVADVKAFVDAAGPVITPTSVLSLGAVALAGGLVYLTYKYILPLQ